MTFKVYIKSNPYSGLTGQLGAAKTYAVNVLANVYSPSNNLQGVYLKDLLIRDDWNVQTLTVTQRGANVFSVNIKMKAIANTTDELRRIEDGIEFTMSKAGVSAQASANFASSTDAPVLIGYDSRPVQTAADISGVSAFTFQVKTLSYIGNLRDLHEEFNRLIIAAFPKKVFTNPSTSYAARGIFSTGTDFVEAVGETTLSSSATKSKLISLMNQAGIWQGFGSVVEFDQKTIQQLQQGAGLKPPSSAVSPYRDNNSKSAPGLFDLDLFKGFPSADDALKAVGIGGVSVGTVAVVLVAFALLRRR